MEQWSAGVLNPTRLAVFPSLHHSITPFSDYGTLD
jgi:hypothetical protein